MVADGWYPWGVGSEALKAKMQALGMRPQTRTDGTLEGILPFRHLVNAFTQSAILAATVRNHGDVSWVFPAGVGAGEDGGYGRARRGAGGA